MEQFLEAGKIVSTHGTRGEVKILPWADSPQFLLRFEQLYINGEPYRVAAARVQNTCVLCKFSGIDDINDAMRLKDKVVCIDRSDAELDDGAVFVADLIGLRVLSGDEEIGKIADVLQPPSNDVYVVRGAHEYLIPAVKEFVTEVNVAGGYVRVKLIEGMRSDEN
jgi:16S rRNA processing protein RimM